MRLLTSEEDMPRLSALKSKRKALAEALRVPAYIIFNDKTLIDMAKQKHTTLGDIARINGAGAKKWTFTAWRFWS